MACICMPCRYNRYSPDYHEIIFLPGGETNGAGSQRAGALAAFRAFSLTWQVRVSRSYVLIKVNPSQLYTFEAGSEGDKQLEMNK